MIHDIIGHAPMLYDPEYVNFLKRLCLQLEMTELKTIDLEYLSLLNNCTKEKMERMKDEIDDLETRLKSDPTLFYKINNIALWTIEFGMLKNADSMLYYGAAIVASPLEINNIRNSLPTILELKNISNDINFNFSDYQDSYFTTQIWEDVIVYIQTLRADFVSVLN